MAIGMKPRGLFGSSGIVATREQEDESERLARQFGMQGQQQHMMGAPSEPKKKQGHNWVGILGDFLGGVAGQPAYYAQGLQRQRLIEQQAQAHRQLEEARRTAGLEDYAAQKRIDAQYAKPDLTSFQKNLTAAGIDPLSPQGLQMARQYAESQADPVIQTTTTGADGATYLTGVPRSRLVGSQQQRPAIGQVVADPFGDGQATMANTASPQLNEQGIPNTMTRQQYQAIVAEKGEAWTAQMVRQHGIQIR